MGAASIISRKEAARKTLMSMELPDKIKRNFFSVCDI